jgi:hypothetical protein
MLKAVKMYLHVYIYSEWQSGSYKKIPDRTCCSCCQITYLHGLCSMLWCSLRFPRKNDVRIFPTICFVRINVLFMLFVFIYIYWWPTRFPYQMMFVSFSSDTTGVTSGAWTTNPSGAPDFTLLGFMLFSF